MTKLLKERILKEHGLVERQTAKGQHKRLVTIPQSNLDVLKTPHMKYLEAKGVVQKEVREQIVFSLNKGARGSR